MSSGVPQANLFYKQVAESRTLWFAENAGGTALEFDTKDGRVTFPLWSTESRILRLKKLNPKLLRDFSPRQISWSDFKDVVVPILRNGERLVGVNFSGKGLKGIDISVEQLIRQVEGHW